MGLANLVPGISGGTMLLASGVYPGFVGAIAELTRLRLRARPIALLGSIGATAALAILLLAGPTKHLVIEQRWVMYSLFIGLTLGGAPIVWRMARPATPALWAGAALGLAAMVLMTFAAPGESAHRASAGLLFGAGLVGAAAMVLPGVSGGYLLLVLGQYLVILGAVDELKEGLRPLAGGSAPDWALLRSALGVVIPVGLGVAAGIVGVSNLMRWTLVRFPKPTLGILLGLLLGAVVGLWPFQASVPPSRWSPEVAAGRSAERPEEWPLERFAPRPQQLLGALALIGAGLAITSAVGRLGTAREEASAG
jgi:putative membrane protein